MDPRKVSAEGDEFFEKGDYESAKIRYHKVISSGYSYADVYNKLGLISYNEGFFEKACGYFEKALEINPRYTEVSLNLAVTYNELGKYDKARIIYSKARQIRERDGGKLDPFVKGKLANLHFETGKIYYEMGLLEEAMAEYGKALALRPDFVDVKVMMGMAFRDSGLFDLAIHEFKKAKEIKPEYAPAGINLGITYYSLSKFKMAEEELLEVQKKHPGNKTVDMYVRLLKNKV